jgi:catechol 2,3-dioxygenase-like lactoylglutathione lyase family enzyme
MAEMEQGQRIPRAPPEDDGALMHHSRLCSLQIDCNVEDIDAAARFWAAALGCPVDMDHPGSRDNYRQLATPPDQPMLQLQRVEHESRVHLDIETDDIDAEVARLRHLGASVFKRLARWVVMQAPSGQRFCVVRVQRAGFAENANAWK